MKAMFPMSVRQACRTLSLSRTVYFTGPIPGAMIQALTELAERYPRSEFKTLFGLLRGQQVKP